MASSPPRSNAHLRAVEAPARACYARGIMDFRQRLDWLLRMALLVFILAGTAFLSAITAIRLAIHGREVEVPNLVGKTLPDAQNLLAGRSLGIRVADRVYSDLPVNSVVRQSPPAGMRVKVRQRAHVVLSLGPRQVAVPLLEGRSLRAARVELLRSGLQIGEISSVYLGDSASDAVIQQDPRPGGGMASPRVNFLVSGGAREPAYVMPYLVGLSQSEAQRQLAPAGVKELKITPVQAPQWTRGTVIEQVPASGARLVPRAGAELRVAE